MLVFWFQSDNSNQFAGWRVDYSLMDGPPAPLPNCESQTMAGASGSYDHGENSGLGYNAK